MNRDLRIGLSLSLLTLGVAGAFCFRADPAAVDPAVAGLEADAAATAAPPETAAPPPPPVRLGPPPSPPAAVAAVPLGPPPLPVPAVGPPPPVDPLVAEPAPPAYAETSLPFPEPLDDLPEELAPPAAEPQTYTVAPGDTLTGIAERTLGSHRKYHKIYEANRDVLEHPDALRVGMTLRIPNRL